MSGSKRLLERIEARGAGLLGDKYVCADCVDDEALKAFIRREACCWRCNYCGNRRRSVEVDDLMDLIMDGIKTEWDDPANEMGWDSREGGWLGVTVDKYDLVSDLEITEKEDLYDDRVGAITNFEWCERDPYGLSRHDRLAFGWGEFCDLVKHKNHFFPVIKPRNTPRFPDPDDISPKELLESLSEIFVELGLIRQLPRGTRVIRARTHSPGVTLRTAGELASPPKELAYMANRMSSPGIPMFYGASNQKTALAEVDYPDSGGAVSVATFETAVPFKVVDLSRLPEVPSIFDLDRSYLRPWTRFIRDFVADFSKPIARDDKIHVEYVPTQYVTAYIQHMMPGNIKGVIYPSSKVKGGKSWVLFFTNEECREDGEGYPKPKRYLKLLPTSIRRFPAGASR